MDQLIGKVLYQAARQELVAVIHDTRTPLRTGSYLSVKFPGGHHQPDLLCIIERPFSTHLSPGQLPGGRTISLRVVSELHAEASTLWSLGETGADVLLPPIEFLTEFFAGHFYSSSKKAPKTAEIPLIVGELRNYEPAVRVSLLGEEMNSHTCVLAQSGAGKSYAVGVILEQIASNTDASIIILDPNSDFVRFGEFLSFDEVNTSENPCAQLSESDYEHAKRIHKSMLDTGKINILGPRRSAPAEESISIAFSELGSADQIRILGIDEVRDVGELLSLAPAISICKTRASQDQGYTIRELWDVASDILLDRISHESERGILQGWVNMHFAGDVERLKAHLTLAVGRLGRALGYTSWKKDKKETTLRTRIHQLGCQEVMILDLGAFEPGVERGVIAAHTLETLWTLHEEEKRGGKKRASFVVLDEAHHLVPGDPREKWQERTADLINRIAGEGRKYGLFLIFISQRPSKIHENTFTQADNYWIMRIQNEEDLAAIRKSVKGIPEGILDRVPYLIRGEALVAGRYIPCPALVRCGRRRTKQGGRTPKIPMRGSSDNIAK